MIRRYRLAAVLAVASVCAAASAFAGTKPSPQMQPIPGLSPARISPLNTSQAACQLGVFTNPTSALNYLFPPNDAYFTRISSADCPTCTGPGGVELTIAHIALLYPVACSQPVQISIVGATGSAACRAPDLSNVIMPPVAVSLNAPANAPGQFWDFPVTLPAGLCLNGDAFLVVNFVTGGAGCATSATRPRLVLDNSCDACQSYNIYPGGNDELCSVGLGGNPLFSVEANCCNVVPALPKSWGSLKIKYRG